MLGHVTRTQQPLVSGAIRGIFTATTHTEARQRLGRVVEQLRPHAPKVARLLEDAEADLLAFYGFPAEHWPKLRRTNPLERVNREIGRRSDVVGSSCVIAFLRLPEPSCGRLRERSRVTRNLPVERLP
jgi:transposase-like protein